MDNEKYEFLIYNLACLQIKTINTSITIVVYLIFEGTKLISLSVCLRIVYLVESEIFLLKIL